MIVQMNLPWSEIQDTNATINRRRGSKSGIRLANFAPKYRVEYLIQFPLYRWQAMELFLFASMMGVTVVIFSMMAYFYKYVTVINEPDSER